VVGLEPVLLLGTQFAAFAGVALLVIVTPGQDATFRQGLLSNLGNPKMAVFFPSLLPQFGQSFAALLALGFVFACMTFVWLTAYAFAVARAGDVLRKPRVKRAGTDEFRVLAPS